MFVFPENSYVEILTLSVMVLGGGSFKGNQVMRNPHEWNHCPSKRGPQKSSVHTVKTQKEASRLQLRKGLSPDTQPCRYPDLGLPATRTVRNKSLLFINHPVCGVLLLQSEQTEMGRFHSPPFPSFQRMPTPWLVAPFLCLQSKQQRAKESSFCHLSDSLKAGKVFHL